MHFCTANIALGGDIRNVMIRDIYNPVSWPEIELIEFMHGTGSVTDVEPFVKVAQTPRAERQRLDIIYGEGPTNTLWGVRNMPREMETGGVVLKQGIEWFNPLTDKLEVSEIVDPTLPPEKKK